MSPLYEFRPMFRLECDERAQQLRTGRADSYDVELVFFGLVAVTLIDLMAGLADNFGLVVESCCLL